METYLELGQRERIVLEEPDSAVCILLRWTDTQMEEVDRSVVHILHVDDYHHPRILLDYTVDCIVEVGVVHIPEMGVGVVRN